MMPRASAHGGRPTAWFDAASEPAAPWVDTSWHQGPSTDGLAAPGMLHASEDAASAIPMTEHLLDRLRAAGL